MYRIALLIALSFGLVACNQNDKKISSWEVNDVYHATVITPNASTGTKTYAGPPINTDYFTDTKTNPARIEFLSYVIFEWQTNHIQIDYTSGFGNTAAQVPSTVKTAIMMTTAALNEHRGDAQAEIFSPAICSLLDPYRNFRFGGSTDIFTM